MRVLLATLALGACATPPPPVIANAGRPSPALDLSWHFQGSARLEADAVKLDYCCVAWGAAERRLAIGPGTWQIELAHANTECTSAAAALVFGGDGMLLAHIPLDAGRTGGIATDTFELDADGGPARLLIGEIGGGYDCCGTTAVNAIQLTSR